MAGPDFSDGRPLMLVAGDDAARKPTVLKLVEALGFEAIDAGELKMARLIEPLGMLWVRLAYAQGLGRNIAFALLRR
jgi:8-hydroxy-5-deazaflavin:NADPH oxidoreductase